MHKESFYLHIIGIVLRKKGFILDVLSKVELWERNRGKMWHFVFFIHPCPMQTLIYESTMKIKYF